MMANTPPVEVHTALRQSCTRSGPGRQWGSGLLRDRKCLSVEQVDGGGGGVEHVGEPEGRSHLPDSTARQRSSEARDLEAAGVELPNTAAINS